MRPSEIAMSIADMQNEIVVKYHELLNTEYVPVDGDSNMVTDIKATIHEEMAKYIKMNTLAAWSGKEASKAKDKIHESLEILEMSTDPVEGTEVTIYEDQDFLIRKKQNRHGISISSTDLEIELTRLGVEKDILDKAKDAASKERKGAVYFTITGSD
jgi:hypothetical protein